MGLCFPSQADGNLAREPAKDFALSIHQVPLSVNIRFFCENVFMRMGPFS